VVGISGEMCLKKIRPNLDDTLHDTGVSRVDGRTDNYNCTMVDRIVSPASDYGPSQTKHRQKWRNKCPRLSTPQQSFSKSYWRYNTVYWVDKVTCQLVDSTLVDTTYRGLNVREITRIREWGAINGFRDYSKYRPSSPFGVSLIIEWVTDDIVNCNNI
jgi:hypothetical protein